MSKASLEIKLEKNEYPEYFEGKGKPKFDYPQISFSDRDSKNRCKFDPNNEENYSSNIQWVNNKFKMILSTRPQSKVK